jgi:hypothetical protein
MLPSHTLRTLKNYNYIIEKCFEQLYIMRKRHGGTSNSPFVCRFGNIRMHVITLPDLDLYPTVDER